MLLGILTTLILCFFLRQGKSLTTFLLTLLASPVLFYLLPVKNTFVAWLVLLALILVAQKFPRKILLPASPYSEWMLLWPLFYFIFYFCCLHHSDFYPLGERFRDLAILGAVKKNFSSPLDPWFTGYELKYYLYWYRLGAFFSQLFALPTAATYHALLSFCFTSFAAILYHFLQLRVGLSKLLAFFLCVLTLLAPNASGLKFLFTTPWMPGAEWWGMTRVILGTINEFPAWSFVLGDLHPHFCQLGMVFLFLDLALTVVMAGEREWGLGRKTHLLLLALLGFFFWRNTNPWELPLIMMLTGILIVFYFFQRRSGPFFSAPAISKKGFFLMGPYLLALTSLILSSRNLPQVDLPLRLISPDWSTDTVSFLTHWFWPLMLIILLPSQSLFSLLSRFALIFVTWYFALPALCLLLPCLLLALYDCTLERKIWWGQGLTVFLFLGLIFPEVFFFDDAYGGANERMNTVFKFYIFLWPLLFVVLALHLKKIKDWATLPLAILTLISLGFFIKLNSIRRPFPSALSVFSAQKAAGLEALEQTFTGGEKTVHFLQTQVGKILAEGSTQAYSWSTHLASLSGLDAYLGWDNHLNLLTREYEEIGRRKKVLRELYGSESCPQRRELMLKEKIDLLALGPLEKSLYQDSRAVDFTCLKLAWSAGLYQLYSP